MSLRKTESVAAALSEVFYFKKVLRLLKKVAQSCPTPCDPIDCSLPGSSVHGIFQARVLEWVPISFSRGSSNPGIEPRSPTLQSDCLPAEPPGKPKNTAVGSLSLLQWIFPTQELNQGLLHCRRVLYHLAIREAVDEGF